jgi:hypothetical protein
LEVHEELEAARVLVWNEKIGFGWFPHPEYEYKMATLSLSPEDAEIVDAYIRSNWRVAAA